MIFSRFAIAFTVAMGLAACGASEPASEQVPPTPSSQAAASNAERSPRPTDLTEAEQSDGGSQATALVETRAAAVATRSPSELSDARATSMANARTARETAVANQATIRGRGFSDLALPLPTIEPSALVSISLTLDDLERQIRADLDGVEGIELDIERRYYVTGAEIRALLATYPVDWHCWERDLEIMRSNQWVQSPYAVVELSHQTLINPNDHCFDDVANCRLGVQTGRSSYAVVASPFPATGRCVLGHTGRRATDDWPERLRDAFVARSATISIERVSPAQVREDWEAEVVHASPTRRPISGDTAVALSEGELPVALRDVARVLPYVPGSQRTFRESDYASRGIGVLVREVTETVGSTFRVDEDVLAFKLNDDDSGFQYLTPRGLGPPLTRSPETIEDLQDPIWMRVQVPYDVTCSADSEPWNGVRHDGLHEVSVPAGTFQGCCQILSVTGGASGVVSWHCPGVGLVKEYRFHFSTMGPGHESLRELVRYQIPHIKLVP